MRAALQVSAFVLVAALWALLEMATANVLTRCLVLWALLAAVWLGVEIAARTSPPDAAAKWIGRTLPAQKPRFLAARRVFAFALGAIFLVAFWSWGSQVRGLVGEHGLIPVGEQLTSARERTRAGTKARAHRDGEQRAEPALREQHGVALRQPA